METVMNFEDIRPYNDDEVKEALQRIAEDSRFHRVMGFLFPELSEDSIKARIRNAKSTYDFQRDFMHKAIRRILENSSDGLTYEGFEFIDPDEPYLYIANHRDIFLDSGILEILLFEHGIDTTEITFGSNLMSDPFMTDVGKVNKMFTVYRGGTSREKYMNHQRLSAYIRHTITEKKNSVWIAQRNGRTKNGDDRTQTGLLKMMNASGTGEFSENFEELNIVPLTISYEFEPCDKFKVKELYHAEHLGQPYEKTDREDLESIIAGVVEPKGRIHMAIGMPLEGELPGLEGLGSDQEKYEEMAAMIDAAVWDDYNLWPGNFYAYDLLNAGKKYVDRYGQEDRERFDRRMEKILSELEGEASVLKELFLRIYANPVINWESL